MNDRSLTWAMFTQAFIICIFLRMRIDAIDKRTGGNL